MTRKRHGSTDTHQTVSAVDILTSESGVPAGIEYVGLSGISKECQDAVLRLLQYGDKITHARILSSSNHHCLLLTVNVGDIVAVKSGFASGYLGEGPRTFSYVLQVLDAYGVEIEEYIVSAEVIERVDTSSLTKADLEAIDAAKPVRPRRWDDYILERHLETNRNGILWQNFPLVIPFAIIDSRITDLAISFWEGPDDRLLTGYRRLEDILRERTGIDEHGTKLFAQAFAPNGGKLTWKDAGDAERAGRMGLFTGAYMAYRNRRAHRGCPGFRWKLSGGSLARFVRIGLGKSLRKENRRGKTISHDQEEEHSGTGSLPGPGWAGAVADGRADRAVPTGRG